MKRYCSECGTDLDERRRDALTCSARCRVARSRRLERAREVAVHPWETASIVVGYPRKRTEATAMAEAVRLHSKMSNWKWRAVSAELREEMAPRRTRRGHDRPAQPRGKFWIVKIERAS